MRTDLIYDFTPDGVTDEPCPGCGEEVEIRLDGTSDCPECGHKEVLPCSDCKHGYDFKCDWSLENRCTVFPR